VAVSGLSEEVRRFLEDVHFAVLATINRDGTPQQTVVWYLLRGDEILMNTARRRVKDRNLRRDPRLSATVEDGYRFVTINGVARLVDDRETAQADIRLLAMRYNGPEVAERQMREQFSREQRVSIILPVEHITTDGFE
jgi:PPOX class probable F420-dependent enzyme